jgi:hypothetical protein
LIKKKKTRGKNIEKDEESLVGELDEVKEGGTVEE